VVWSGWDGSDWEIFLYDGASTTQITNNGLADSTPHINNNGHVVWSGSDGSDDEVFLYNGTSTTQITNNGLPDSTPHINDNGYMVWSGGKRSGREIFLAFPCALNDDYDGDGYISIACGGNDCHDGDTGVNPGMSESEAASNCLDWKDNDCDGSPDCHDSDCPDCPASCSGSAVASTLGVGRSYGASDLGKHLAYFLLPVGAVIVIRTWRRKK
jgi:hypothetical protein